MNKVVVLRLILIACIGSFMGFIVAQQWHQSSISTTPEQALCDASQQWCGSVNGNQAINMRVLHPWAPRLLPQQILNSLLPGQYRRQICRHALLG